jgi:hypothetical protein
LPVYHLSRHTPSLPLHNAKKIQFWMLILFYIEIPEGVVKAIDIQMHKWNWPNSVTCCTQLFFLKKKEQKHTHRYMLHFCKALIFENMISWCR